MGDAFSAWLDAVDEGEQALARSVIAFVRETLDDAEKAAHPARSNQFETDTEGTDVGENLYG